MTAVTLVKPSSATSLAVSSSASGWPTTTTAAVQRLASIASTAWASRGRPALLAVTDGEVADDLGDLEDVAGLETLDVALEAAAPVALGRGLPGAQDLEDAVDVVGAADLADADLLAVVARHHEGEVAICQ